MTATILRAKTAEEGEMRCRGEIWAVVYASPGCDAMMCGALPVMMCKLACLRCGIRRRSMETALPSRGPSIAAYHFCSETICPAR
jgi:hypothetical protein